MTEIRKDYTKAERDEMAASGEALEDGSYPIKTVQDLKNAVKAFGRAKNPDAAKAHIKKRAKALGATDELPEDWSSSRSQGRKSPNREVELRLTEFRTEVHDEGTKNEALVLTGVVAKTDHSYFVYDGIGPSDGFQETICRGALENAKIEGAKFLYNHAGIPMASVKAGTLQIRETEDDGIICEARLNPQNLQSNALYHAVKDGDLSQMSIGMVVGADQWDSSFENRTITRLAAVTDCSVVDNPANDATFVSARNAEKDNARVEHIKAEARAGRSVPAEAVLALLSDDTETDTEERSFEDYCIAEDIRQAFLAVQNAIASQQTDPDVDTGEFDSEVNDKLLAAAQNLVDAIKLQAQDIQLDNSVEMLSSDEPSEEETRTELQRLAYEQLLAEQQLQQF